MRFSGTYGESLDKWLARQALRLVRISDLLDIKFATAVRELLLSSLAGLPSASGHPTMTGDSARAEARLQQAARSGHYRTNLIALTMVFLAIPPAGLKEALRLKKLSEINVWCGSAAVSATDYDNEKGNGISRFEYDFAGAERDDLLGALDTIEQHHPGEVIWVEGIPEA